LALRQRRLARQVIGIGRHPERLAKAFELGAVDEWTLDPLQGVSAADLVAICTPVGSIAETFQKIVSHLKPGCIVSDMGSTKSKVVATCEEIAPESIAFVGGHPMAGSEAAGVEAARPDLYEGAVYVLTGTPRTDPEALARLEALTRALGATPLRLAPEDHDRIVAVVSHLPHLLAWALVRMAGESSQEDPSLFKLAAGSFRDMTRVAASSPEMWRDIFLTNREHLLTATSRFRKALDDLEAAVAGGDTDVLERILAEGQAVRQSLYVDRRTQ